MLAGATALVAAPISVVLGVAGVDTVSNTGPDYQGIAMLIGSIATLIATLIAGYIALFKPRDDPMRELAIEMLEERAQTRNRRADDET